MITVTQNRTHQSYNSRGVLTYNYQTDIHFKNEQSYDKYRKYQYVLAREREEEECQRRREREESRKNWTPPKPKTNEELFEGLSEYRKKRVREIMGL